MGDKLAPTEAERHVFRHNDQKVYEWDQTLEEVNIYVDVPPGIRAGQLFCEIGVQSLKFGIKGNPPFLDQKTFAKVLTEESFWTLEDGVLHVQLTKMAKAQTWSSALEGHGQLDPLTAENDQKRLMLERFQQENPGFDFSGATFNGAVPDPRTFMGGVSYGS